MICDECETVAHCMKNGCVPKTNVQQEPVLMFYEYEWQGQTSRQYQWLVDPFSLPKGTKLYTSPPAQRKPLTDEQIGALLGPFPKYASEWGDGDFYQFARVIEAAHGIKEKNT